ncbi:MAG TPA: CheR family methyltransferase [Prolixibacteraceae bacterium]|nr:CheR family methyltransferase [Prolixibacteraceae bacterium]
MSLTEAQNIYSQKLEEPEFNLIQDFMLNNLGVKLSPIKIVMVNSRLIKRLRASGIYNFPDYVRFALSAEGKRTGELQCMIDELTTHKTDFFREPEQYNFLMDVVMPEFSQQNNHFFKIWSAGCSSGEEPYTMAMLLNQYQLTHAGFDFSIAASDVSNGILNKAISGIYNEQTLKDVDQALVKRYFTPLPSEGNNNTFAVNKILKDKISFSIINLVDHYKFLPNYFDVIFCRNTLIYFEDQAKRDVVKKLISKIKVGGYLFVGLSETVSQYSKDIKQVSPSIYKKIV